MRIRNRIIGIITGAAICLLMTSTFNVRAGSLDPPGAPGATSSYSLEDIYSRLNIGTAGPPGTFTEPSAGPTAGTMHTLNEIMGKAPVVDAGGASAGDVMAGKTFWGLTSGGWGPRIGTLATRTVSNATVSQAAGYYSAFNLSTVDPNLATGNIISGKSIFGVPGSVLQATGTAAAGDVLSTKTFSNYTATGVPGAMPNNGAVTMTPGTADQSIAAGYHNGSGKVSGDANLATANIKSGATIFGVSGSVLQATGTAGAGDVLTGKTFSNSVANNQNGSMANNGSGGTIVPGTVDQTLAAGYWSNANTVKGDANLLPGNIVSGETIFGVTGTALGATGNATVNDVRLGKTFSNSAGSGLTGNLAGGVSVTCSSGSSSRWCNNGNGTVTDTTTGLVWLKDASWGGKKTWVDSITWDDAQTRAGTLSNGAAGAGLTDGSVVGDWRLPTKTELEKLTTGTEPVSSGSPQLFTGVQSDCYWSSTTSTNSGISNIAWDVSLGNRYEYEDFKSGAGAFAFYVWPVRAGQ
ncbi:MAG: DUF1566 domain-containing protein [Deltaproteobacteria bacterium]|nr:DUF1566 domain-containing protein [Deltaproteobacteria bacterium]